MTHIEEINYREVGDLYGRRTWVEYGIKQSKSELGWTDFRLTEYAQIEKWCGAGDAPPPGKWS